MKTKLLATAITLLFLSAPAVVLAQNFSVASTYQINDTDAISGDIMTTRSGKGLIRADSTYDTRIFGVFEDIPLIVYRNTNALNNEKPIIRAGDGVVNITDINGSVAAGDYITSSQIAGKGMKANQSGYVIGVATSAVTPGIQIEYEGKKVSTGQVNVAIRIEYAELNTSRNANRLLEQVNAAFFRNVQDPEKFTLVIRYIMAGVVALVFFLISFFGFTRSTAKGIEAIGRNPLARSSIQLSIVIHLGLAIVVCLIGLVISFLIIRV